LNSESGNTRYSNWNAHIFVCSKKESVTKAHNDGTDQNAMALQGKCTAISALEAALKFARADILRAVNIYVYYSILGLRDSYQPYQLRQN
jgi:hypothetical protein